MSDIKLNDNGDDIDLTDLNMTLVTGVDAVSQEAQIGMRFFQGEWFLDTRVGIPYFQYILGVKNPNVGVIAAIYSRALLTIPGITQIDSVAVEMDNETRTLSVDWRAVAEDSNVVETIDRTTVLVLP